MSERESRPTMEAAPQKVSRTDCSDRNPNQKLPGYGARQLEGHRRRREAALRLPPLANSRRRDPLTSTEVALGRTRDRR